MEKIFTIKNNRTFTRMYRAQSSAQGTIVVYYKKSPKLNKAQIGITASKKLGSAVKRNRARRLIREAYRTLVLEGSGINDMPYYFVFVARSRCFSDRARMQDVYRDLKTAFSTIGLIGEKE